MEQKLFKQKLLVFVIGLCPSLAVTTTGQLGLALGTVTSIVLLSSILSACLIRKFLPDTISLTAILIIIAAVTSIADLVIALYWPELSARIGIYIPLIAVNCIIYSEADAVIRGVKVFKIIYRTFFSAAIMTFVLILLGALREVLGSGTIMGYQISRFHLHANFFLLPSGALILLGITAALITKCVTFSRWGKK